MTDWVEPLPCSLPSRSLSSADEISVQASGTKEATGDWLGVGCGVPADCAVIGGLDAASGPESSPQPADNEITRAETSSTALRDIVAPHRESRGSYSPNVTFLLPPSDLAA